MNIHSTSKIKKIILNLSNNLIDYIENNGNDDFLTNGEMEAFSRIVSCSQKSNPMIVFDVGSNNGDYSTNLIKILNDNKRKYQLHLFEPVESTFFILNRRFSNNSSVKLNNFAVSDTQSYSVIYYDKKVSKLASIYKRNLKSKNIKFNKSEKIKIEKLSSYIKKNNVKCIDFLKLDIEGNEYKAMLGLGKYLSPRFIKNIQFEFGGADLDSNVNLRSFFTLLENKGFIVAKVMKKGLELKKYSYKIERYTSQNFLAIGKKYTS